MSEPDDPRDALLELALSGRADRHVDVALAGSPAQITAELAGLREALASLALDVTPVLPSPELKARIAASLLSASAAPRRAVVVVDMQNDHLEPGGPLEVPRARGIVPALAARLEAARDQGVPVVFVVDEHDPGDSDLDSWGAHNLRGTHGAEVWPELTPRPGDCVVSKATYSAFTGSKLAAELDALAVDTLELTGCLTEIGLFATATDALQQGYVVEVPAATQAGAAQVHEEVALGVLALLPPYGPARKALLARRAETVAAL